MALLLCHLAMVCGFNGGTIHNIDAYGARRGDTSTAAAIANQQAFMQAFAAAADGDTVLVSPGKDSYEVLGGLNATALRGVVLRIDGNVALHNNLTAWPKDERGECCEVRTVDP